MWLFNRPPKKELQERYGFDPTPEWLAHVQKSSVRFNNGGSGSFVSADGLVMTNHHVGADCLQKLSDAAHNYLRDGFYAKTRAEEKQCLDLELNVLESIEDVTARVNAAVKPGMPSDQAFSARRAVMNEIENESNEEDRPAERRRHALSGGRIRPLSLQALHRRAARLRPRAADRLFRRRSGQLRVSALRSRHVFFPRLRKRQAGPSPSTSIGARGARPTTSWSSSPAIRVAPTGSTRLPRCTISATSVFRICSQRLYRWEVMLTVWSARSDENARRAHELCSACRIAARPAMAVWPACLIRAHGQETGGRGAASRRRRARIRRCGPRPRPGRAWRKHRRCVRRSFIATRCSNAALGLTAPCSRSRARWCARPTKRAKPERDRLREFTAARRPSLELELFSTEPIYKDFETLKLADSLTWLTSQLRNDPQFVRQILAGKSPQERAYELVHGTKLESVELRKKLYEEGAKAVAASNDPMIELARLVDPPARAVRKIMETKVEEVERQAYAQIAKDKYAVGGSERLSRRDVHPASRVRDREGLRGRGKASFPLRPRLPVSTSAAASITTSRRSTFRPDGSNGKTSSI